ncbi:MAG: DUF3987 domain-containing protein [Acidobacteria bacterium]|nr:DUF3987 domain-containing protein [Acidobacteriota bacterium]
MSVNLGVLEGAIPEDGLFRRYIEWAEPVTDAPIEFHVASSLALAGTVAGRKIWLDRGHGRLYPNVWVLILAPSSFYRKSTAISQAEHLLWDYRDGVYLLPNEASPEKFLDNLKSQPTGLFRHKEFAALLAQFDRSYMMGFKELLTELYDCPRRYTRTLRREEVVVENPCLSILAASTFDWLLEKTKAGDIRGGFFSRFLYFAPRLKSKRLAFPLPGDEGLENRIANEICLLDGMEGEVRLADDARDYYERWIFNHEDELDGHEHAGMLSGFYTRYADYALKFAMLYAATADRSLIVSRERVIQAIELVEFLKATIRRLVTEDFTFSWYDKHRKRVLDQIRRSGGRMEYSPLLKNLHLPANQVGQILGTMCDDGTLVRDGKWVMFAGIAPDSQGRRESETHGSKGFERKTH